MRLMVFCCNRPHPAPVERSVHKAERARHPSPKSARLAGSEPVVYVHMHAEVVLVTGASHRPRSRLQSAVLLALIPRMPRSPPYSDTGLDWIGHRIGLDRTPDWIGSDTGLVTRQRVENGNSVAFGRMEVVDSSCFMLAMGMSGDVNCR